MAWLTWKAKRKSDAKMSNISCRASACSAHLVEKVSRPFSRCRDTPRNDEYKGFALQPIRAFLRLPSHLIKTGLIMAAT
jgi:hypothetical protein